MWALCQPRGAWRAASEFTASVRSHLSPEERRPFFLSLLYLTLGSAVDSDRNGTGVPRILVLAHKVFFGSYDLMDFVEMRSVEVKCFLEIETPQ